MAASAPSALWADGGELLAHRLVHCVDRLQRSGHHLEAVDSIFGIPIDDVDTIDRQTSESGLEIQYSRCRRTSNSFPFPRPLATIASSKSS